MSLDPDRLQLYLVADPDHSALPLADGVTLALATGVTAVQLRAKRMDDRAHLALARTLRNLCRQHNALFLVNDRLDIALLAEADGVHVGVSDVAPADIRQRLGTDFVIGYSPGSSDDRSGAPANYLGIGPVFGTTSKADAGDALGLDTLRQRVLSTQQPVIGIGGITADNARSVLDAGATGIAVLSTILRAADVTAATSELRRAVFASE